MQTAEKLPQCERALNQCYVSPGETTRDGRDKEGEEMTELTCGGERERTFIDNQEVTEGRISTTPCRVTPPLGARAPAYDGECYSPTLRVAMCVTPLRTQRGSDRQRSVPITWPLPGDAPRGTCLRPGAKVSGSQTDLLTPWYHQPQ
jgi:hypothetical protein